MQYCFCLMFFGLEVCGILAPWPRIESASPAFEGQVLTTGPPGKSLGTQFWSSSGDQKQAPVWCSEPIPVKWYSPPDPGKQVKCAFFLNPKHFLFFQSVKDASAYCFSCSHLLNTRDPLDTPAPIIFLLAHMLQSLSIQGPCAGWGGWWNEPRMLSSGPGHAPRPHCHLVHCHLPSLNSVHKHLAVIALAGRPFTTEPPGKSKSRCPKAAFSP